MARSATRADPWSSNAWPRRSIRWTTSGLTFHICANADLTTALTMTMPFDLSILFIFVVLSCTAHI